MRLAAIVAKYSRPLASLVCVRSHLLYILSARKPISLSVHIDSDPDEFSLKHIMALKILDYNYMDVGRE